MPKPTPTAINNVPIKVVTVNRQAYHDYTVERTVEAGISLVGTEIKSIRERHVNLRGSMRLYATARSGWKMPTSPPMSTATATTTNRCVTANCYCIVVKSIYSSGE